MISRITGPTPIVARIETDHGAAPAADVADDGADVLLGRSCGPRTPRPACVELVDEGDWIGITVIVLGELRAGFGVGKRRVANERELGRFLDNPVVHVLAVDEEAAQI